MPSVSLDRMVDRVVLGLQCEADVELKHCCQKAAFSGNHQLITYPLSLEDTRVDGDDRVSATGFFGLIDEWHFHCCLIKQGPQKGMFRHQDSHTGR